MTQLKRLLSVILCIVLIAATALFAIGCSTDKNDTANQSEKGNEIISETPKTAKEVGEGSKKFEFIVKDLDGNETKFLVKTDKKTVGEALLEVGLIEGEEGQYGLYVKKVNGVTADYDVDKTYWAFYVDGSYASSGVDTTTIDEDVTYKLEYTK